MELTVSNPDVLYVADLARRLGRTETAIRAALRRKSASVPHEHAFMLGAEIAVRASDYSAWLDAKIARKPDARIGRIASKARA